MSTSRDLPHDAQLDYFRIADDPPKTHFFSLHLMSQMSTLDAPAVLSLWVRSNWE
jgi:hypothetical protein